LTEKTHSKKTYLSITSYIISKLNIAKRCIRYIFLSVRPSVTHRYCAETTQAMITGSKTN